MVESAKDFSLCSRATFWNKQERFQLKLKQGKMFLS